MEENNQNQEVNSDDLTAEITESYGTGVKDLPGYNIGGRSLRQRKRQYTHTSPEITGGDVDAYWQQEDTVGDEAVGGTAPTPDQSVTDDLGKAVGLPMNDGDFLHTEDILERRDHSRWELDPMSSDDYQERKD
ncbi:DUF6335 family protein [Anabaenopsis tanganyikae CS-531]|uniref:DUF6335 family protein n=2 Tax=Anabaenopsis TaxID=110103 RepID=A0ABT5AY13_9CYAN|nr:MULTISPECIES: DUF6335 family protein [Anabaenopsis]MDB9541190.1 DUF6335 family protein [Anabaenopsis arnoldii]MDH6093629.1 DUF6335 family protein [Anabaenopsis arnoldii]MDH6098406.1 DUF6335 family protein [Anabaenopsis sp. FSS-46]MDH6105863.1 DUF6335 family protein [Anabaenopsis tanganyikae CS-531]